MNRTTLYGITIIFGLFIAFSIQILVQTGLVTRDEKTWIYVFALLFVVPIRSYLVRKEAEVFQDMTDEQMAKYHYKFSKKDNVVFFAALVVMLPAIYFFFDLYGYRKIIELVGL